jgi:hypothetical protein
MMARCLLMLAVGFMDTGGEALADMGQVKWDFSVPSHWVLVRGRQSNFEVVKASLTFKRPEKVELVWETEEEGGFSYVYHVVRKCRTDPLSGLPQIVEHVWGAKPSIQLLGDHLMLTIRWQEAVKPWDGTLHLILKRAP